MAEMKNQYEKLWDQITSRGTKGYCRNARIYRCHLTAALKLYNVLLTQFQRLKSFPLSGKELEATNVPLNFLYRWKRVENYLVFYTIDVESKIANIMRVVYRYSNYLTILK